MEDVLVNVSSLLLSQLFIHSGVIVRQLCRSFEKRPILFILIIVIHVKSEYFVTSITFVYVTTFKHDTASFTEVPTGTNITNGDVLKMGRTLCQVCHVWVW